MIKNLLHHIRQTYSRLNLNTATYFTSMVSFYEKPFFTKYFQRIKRVDECL